MSDGQMEPRIPLDPLDPGGRDAAYWRRFRNEVLARATPELARRRRLGEEVTISDLVLSWSRLLVPGTVVAAAAAALLLFLPAEEPDSPMLVDVEELLVRDLADDGDLVPYGFFTDEDADLEVFLVAVEGAY